MSKSPTYLIRDPGSFKHRNLENWRINSAFWLEGRCRHQRDISDFVGELLETLIFSQSAKPPLRLADYGFGDGWIYRLLKERKLPVKYIGIDFNPAFVGAFHQRYGDEPNRRVYCYDLEKPLPSKFKEKVDVGVNCFNFFEIPKIEAAFANVAGSLRPGGLLLVVTLDPLLQLLAVSPSLRVFRQNLADYEKFGGRMGYDKDIDIGDKPSGRVYKGILYSVPAYINIARQNRLKLLDFREKVKSANKIPQVYQFIVFRKDGH